MLKAKAKPTTSGRKRVKYDLKVPEQVKAKVIPVQRRADEEMKPEGKKTIKPTVIRAYSPK